MGGVAKHDPDHVNENPIVLKKTHQIRTGYIRITLNVWSDLRWNNWKHENEEHKHYNAYPRRHFCETIKVVTYLKQNRVITSILRVYR